MSKTAELQAELEDLRKCGERIIDIADYLIQIFSSADKPKETHKKTKAPKIAIEDIRSIMKELTGNGYGKDMKEILAKYNADNLSSLSPDEYEGVMKDLEVFGNAT